MSRGFQGAVMRALGANDHLVRVEEVHDVVDGFRRVHFSSETLFDTFRPGPTDYVRLWFPDPQRPEREVQRGYTVLQPDPTSGMFVIDFVLHEPSGPASQWAATCAVGDTLAAMPYGTKPFRVATPEPEGYLLVGDAASIPAINSILETIPPHVPVVVVLEWGDARELEIPLASHPSATVHRIARDHTGGAVVAAIAGRDWTGWSAWIGAERATVTATKRALIDTHGFPKSECTAQAYWVHGRSFGASRGSNADTATDTAPPAQPIGTAAGQPVAASADVPAAEPVIAPAAATGWRSQAGAELVAPLKGMLRVAGALQLILTLAELVPFVLLAEVGRRLLDGQSLDDQWPLARFALILLGSASLLSAAMMLWLHVIDARFALQVRRRILTKLTRLPLGWFTERNSATAKQIVSDDTGRLHYYVTHAAVDIVAAIVAPLAVMIYLFVVDARLAALMLVPVIGYWVVFRRMVRESGAKIDEVAAWGRRMNAEAVGFLDGLPVVRTFGGASASGFRRSVDEYTEFLGNWQRPFVRRKATSKLLTDPMTFLAIIVVGGAALIWADSLSPADLLPFLLLGTTFGGRLLAIAYNGVGLRESRAAAQRIGLTLTEPELPTVEVAERAPAGHDIRLHGVTFGYRPGHPVLHDIDLTLPAGTITALVGPSGSGKSTLAALVARFHDPDAGQITIGGVDLRLLPPDELYRRVGFVFQDVHLVRASLHDNIALGRPDAARAEVERVAKLALLDDLAARLPDGFDTDITATVRLSGGEAQRVAIARAILADPSVIVLDEATAFADPDSEHQVQVALSRLLAGRTVLVIAHRLHTIVDADQIVVLDHGRVVQRGRHDELLAAPGRYRDLWELSGVVAR